MSKMRVITAMACCLAAMASIAGAQPARKPGLWEMTSTMNMGGSQMPQMPANAQMPQNMQLPPGVKLPPGMQMPGGAAGGGSPFGSPRTTQICVTQAMIDKFGGPSPAPQNHGADCQMSDVVIKPDGMTAKINCSGQMNATGNVETTFVDANTVHSKTHITGNMQLGANSRPMDMTVESTSVYKGPDCGNVKPPPMPSN
ncbi:MAG: DUF3617 family protein [Terracidiphilus sp.]|jgi:hypothetical protein